MALRVPFCSRTIGKHRLRLLALLRSRQRAAAPLTFSHLRNPAHHCLCSLTIRLQQPSPLSSVVFKTSPFRNQHFW
ncbi:hypothetical protein L1887_14412 [Cichorium endivia]|nr:hypothetical protein L1887_14412 [Cichorium endivia]